MHNKFNIALVPADEYLSDFVAYAKKSFSIQAAEYLLGTHSVPHVTLCHFIIDESKLDEIHHKVLALKQPPIQLHFSTQRSKTYPADSLWGEWSWVSLLPDKLDELKKLHLQIATIVTPTNSAFDDYDPHLTLFNSRDKAGCESINQAPQVNPVLSGTFEIKLGRLDDIGQITEIL